MNTVTIVRKFPAHAQALQESARTGKNIRKFRGDGTFLLRVPDLMHVVSVRVGSVLIPPYDDREVPVDNVPTHNQFQRIPLYEHTQLQDGTDVLIRSEISHDGIWQDADIYVEGIWKGDPDDDGSTDVVFIDASVLESLEEGPVELPSAADNPLSDLGEEDTPVDAKGPFGLPKSAGRVPITNDDVETIIRQAQAKKEPKVRSARAGAKHADAPKAPEAPKEPDAPQVPEGAEE